MSPDERRLLLTIGRVVRAKIADEVYGARDDDLAAINDALAPFDPNGEPERNECDEKAR